MAAGASGRAAAAPAPPGVARHDGGSVSGPLLLWAAFVLVHGLLAAINLHAHAANPIGDVRIVYLGWAQDVLSDRAPGIDTPFVYPVLALAPVLAALAFGAQSYAESWMLLVTLLDAAAFAVLVGAPWRREPLAAGVRAAAWFWLAFLVLLGPIAMGRIDAVTVPLAVVALLWAGRRPVVAATLLAVATWMKVWPAAVVAALLIVSRQRGRILGVAAAVSAGVVLAALSLGSGPMILSFLGEQTGRGLQIEAPMSTVFLWRAAAGLDATVYYDADILTYQVRGAGTAAVSAWGVPLMAVAILCVVAIGVRAIRRGADATLLLTPLTLALVTALIVFNKVGSPQFVCWLAPVVMLGLVTARNRVRLPVVLSLGIAGLTHLVYPYLYGSLLAGEPAMLLVLTARNLLMIALFCWCVRRVWKAGSAPGAPPAGGDPHPASLRAARGRIQPCSSHSL